MTLSHSNTGNVGSNRARDMDIRPRFLVCVEALRWTDPLYEGAYQNV